MPPRCGCSDQIVTEGRNIDGSRVERVRLRRAGNRYFVDAPSSVSPTTRNLEAVHALTDKMIEKRIAQIVPAGTSSSHAEPRAPRVEHRFESVRAPSLSASGWLGTTSPPFSRTATSSSNPPRSRQKNSAFAKPTAAPPNSKGRQSVNSARTMST